MNHIMINDYCEKINAHVSARHTPKLHFVNFQVPIRIIRLPDFLVQKSDAILLQ